MKYQRLSFEVDAIQYEFGKGIEDGFELWSTVVTNGWVNTDRLFQITKDDGKIVCPFITNRRGNIFIREGDYVISEQDGERHVCGADKFHDRFKPLL